MKNSYIMKLKTKNKNSLYDILPKINLTSKVLNTSPNRKIPAKNIKHISTYRPLNADIIKSTKKIKSKRYKQNKTIDLIHRLNLETNINDTYMEEIQKEKKREKINNNTEIIERRLGLFKKEELNFEEENMQKDSKYINELSVEKLSIKDRERKVEKNYTQSLKDIEVMEKQLSELNKKIEICQDNIENKKLQIDVIDQYQRMIDEKDVDLEMESAIKSKVLERKYTSNSITERKLQTQKSLNFEQQSKLLAKKYLRDEKQKQIQNSINEDEKELRILLKEKENLKEKLIMKRKKIFEYKQFLVNLYHNTLFEGLDSRGEGLVKIILNIWDLGANIDMNFMPSFFDNNTIEYLFKRARQILEINKVNKSILDNEVHLFQTLKDWKNDNNYKDINDDNKLKRNYFFKTKIHDDTDDSFLETYPKTKLFMTNYKNTHENESEKKEVIKVNNTDIKTFNLPKAFIDQNKKIEKLRSKYQFLKNKMEKDEKKEVMRLCKEFTYNNYEKKYKVCIDTIIGSLFGEQKKDELLNYYDKLRRENRDNYKLIEFYSPLKNRIKAGKNDIY